MLVAVEIFVCESLLSFTMLHVRPVGASWAARCASAACRVGTMCVPLVHTLWIKIVTKTSRREEWLSWVGATIAVLVVQG